MKMQLTMCIWNKNGNKQMQEEFKSPTYIGLLVREEKMEKQPTGADKPPGSVWAQWCCEYAVLNYSRAKCSQLTGSSPQTSLKKRKTD